MVNTLIYLGIGLCIGFSPLGNTKAVKLIVKIVTGG